MLSLTKNTSRQREILEVVFHHGWDYMKGLLTGNQSKEPQLPTPEVLCNILIDLGPVYVKLGQLLSTRPDLLPKHYIEALSELQSNVPPVSWPEINQLLEQELPQPSQEIFQEIKQIPIAAGSIAQVHQATLKNGQKVALKVQRPGIETVVDQDIKLIKGIAELVSFTDFGEDYDIVAIADEFTTALRAELDFTMEAEYTTQLRLNLAESRWFDPKKLVIPQVHWELTTSKLLILDWLDGTPLLSAKIPEKASKDAKESPRREITTLLFRAFFQQIYINGFFHADPHPGNLFYLKDGRVAILDCGMVGRLDPRTQQILTEMLLAVVDIDAQRCAQLTLELAEAGQPMSLARLENDYDSMLRKYYNLSISQLNFSEVFYEVLQVARNNRIRLPSNMGLYAKTLANLEGVARAFDPEVNFLNQIKPLMTDLFRRQLLGDNPIETFLRTALDLKSLSLRSPRQMELLLDRVTSETLKWNVNLRNIDPIRSSLDNSANRIAFSIIVGSLIMGASNISSSAQSSQLFWLSNILFTAASLLGLWLAISILRSGNLK